MNSFADTATHQNTLDFSAYQIAGWSLYEVLISTSRVVALSEREVVGTSSSPTYSNFNISETPIGNKYYDQLAQGFYNLGHDGKLENISILYDSDYYDPSNQNYAYFDIRSDYQDGSTNLVSSVQLAHVGLTATWAHITESTILDADTTYYAVMNGTKLVEYFDIYPVIRWYYQNTAGSFLTRRYSTEFSAWSSDRPYEALLNYTYTPWNTTSNLAMEYSNPSNVSLQANSSSLSGTEWLFSSTTNVSQVQFSSNQSISIEYDLTLRYKKGISSTTSWYVGSSGFDVTWNVTSVADFPELSGSLDKNLTLALPNDWTANHLFNITSPTQYYDYFSQDGSNVVCSLLGDETWILECTSPNYLQSISKFDSSDDSVITDQVSVLVTMDINSTIESPLSVIATNGDASLRVFYQSSVEYEENYTVAAGKSYHQWDISTDSSSNGLHTVEIYWMNGTEAGYRTSDVLVYYETTLVADDYSINAFTDNTFYIGIDFDRVFPVGGLDGSVSDLTYSFGAVVNQSLTDQSNGRWDATVSTTSMSPGTYDLYVYAEGYALENRSLTIQISLTHDTEALTFAWSNTNDITYIESTELSVYYNRVTGSTPIPDAIVNVTIGVKTWNLTWDGSTAYKITFNGTDVPPGFGLHDLTIEAWKAGHVARSDTSLTLNIQAEPTTMTYEWSNGDVITYIESTTLIVNYTMSDGSPVSGAAVNVTIGSLDPFILTFNGSVYKYVFDGDAALPGIGTHSLNIAAGRFGFDYKDAISVPLTVSLEPTTMTYEWSNGNVITYVGSTTIIVNYTMSDGLPVSGAAVNVTIGSMDPFILTFNGSVYKYVFEGDTALPGLDVHSLTIFAGKRGYENKTTTSVPLTINEEPTTLVITWSASNNVSFIGETYLIANYTMSNGSAVLGATINVTIGAYPPWDLVWDNPSQTYRVLFSGTDDPPGLGVHTLTILADKFGYSEKNNVSQMILREEFTDLVLGWSDGNSITYIGQTILSAYYTMENGTAIRNAMVNVSVGGASALIMTWHEASQTYRIVFSGSDNPPGFGNHSILVLADIFGYRDQSEGSYLNITVEPTTIDITWSNGTTITYVQQTTLTVTYRRGDTTPIADANVTALVGTTLFNLTWNPGSSAYEITFNGTDNPPDIGTYNVIIGANKFGFQSQNNDTYWLTINIETTFLELSWWVSDTISYVGQTVLYANFSMSDGSPVLDAYVNASIGTREWIFEWNEFQQMYMLILSGNHPDIGVGVFPVIINATLYGFASQSNTTETLTVNEEITNLEISWSNGYNLTYFHHTLLSADYHMSNGTPITSATLIVIIGTDTWDMVWNETALLYQVRFNGSDSTPGVGEHSLTVQASKYGYISQTNDTLTLILPVIPTTVEITWSNGPTITYIEQTTLIVTYSMYNGTRVENAIVYLSIGAVIYPCSWNGDSYEHTFFGTDDPPGFENHSTAIHAMKNDFESHLILDQYLTISEDPTTLVINWSNSNNISYVSGTTLSVRYQDSYSNPIQDALVNVTINGRFWNLSWNLTNQTYEIYIAGDENPPGFGNYTVQILASKYGYVALNDTSQEFTIHLEETRFEFVWEPSDTITYVEHTTIKIFYLMSNNTPIEGAVVNVTWGPFRWDALWNNDTKAYEITWLGNDNDLGSPTSHSLVIRAWKINYVGLTNFSQVLTIIEEPTAISASWTNGNSITFTESTTLLVNYTTSNGTVIPYATVDVTIAGTGPWLLSWNSTSKLYWIAFNNESAAWPGLGTFGLSIRGWDVGYETTVNNSHTLTILSEEVSIESKLLGGNTITYVGSTVLQVNYTTTSGLPIAGATVNVTINGSLWDLRWHEASQTYRIQLNGSDPLLGFDTFNLIVNASAYGFDPYPDTSLYLTIILEPTTLVATWGSPNFNSVTYFDYTILYVEYRMENESVILGASVNVTIGAYPPWSLNWNASAGAYCIRFNGSDSPPGFGTHTLSLEASLYGYLDAFNSSSLTLARDPTTIDVSWIKGNNITYVEYTILSVVYRMSNGSNILEAAVNATIGAYPPWSLNWNASVGAYQVRFDGNQIPPGLGTFTIDIQASSPVFEAQFTSTSLTLRTDSPTVTPSWSSNTFDWTESVVLSFDFVDSQGKLIEDATTKLVFIDGVDYVLYGTNGTYWIEFNSTFDLGLHTVWANFSKYGYDPTSVTSIEFTINKALTGLTVIWSSTTVDYLEHIDLTVDYYYIGTGVTVPSAGAVVNITIDGTFPLDLVFNGSRWIGTLTRSNLSLGIHDVDIRAQVYGYEYSESLDIVLTVNNVATDALVVTWVPSNGTIEYTDLLNLTVDYTFYGGDVPDTAWVNVSVDGRLYNLTYSAGLWRVSIPGEELGLGPRTATISAWLYGYQYKTNITAGINVTAAANAFIPTWEPFGLQASYLDTINLTVLYQEDFVSIDGATVKLSINGTIYTLEYNDTTELWHFSMKASDIGLGVWNVTVTANKTGYADGWNSRLLTISLAQTNLTVVSSYTTIYYDEVVTLSIYYQLLNTSVVPGASCTVILDSVLQSISWVTDHWVVTLSGAVMGLGVHSVSIDVDAYGFESDNDLFDVTVNIIPTSVVVDSAIYNVYPYDSVSVSFTWIDDKNAVGIDGYSPTIEWPGTYSVVEYGNGIYSIELTTDALHVGIYHLNVTFTRTGYVEGTSTAQIEMVELPIVLTYDNEILQYENETITISIQIYDGPHATIVNWGEIVIDLEGVEYTLTYLSGTQEYSVDIWLGTLTPRTYSLNFTASATDCETETGEIQLVIEPKSLYDIVVDADEEIQAGQSILISIQVNDGSEIIEGFEVTLHIVVDRVVGQPQEYVESRSNSFEFTVPLDATQLTIWAEFDGSIEEWPAVSNTITREVTSSGIPFGDPMTLIMIVGGAGGGVLVVLFLIRRRWKKSSS
ncbi:MAG: hypothetical protein ACFFF9_08450 [Candidatus Thorarchaeota archaeon]